MAVTGRILMIDDDPMFADGFRRFASLHGYEVIVHPTPLTVAFVMRSANPDLVLLDVSMPSLSSGTFQNAGGCRALRTDAPVLLFSGKDRPFLATLCQELGADGYISKVDDLDHILRQISLFVAHRRMFSKRRRA